MSSPMRVPHLLASLLLLSSGLRSEDEERRPSFRIYDVKDLLSRPIDYKAPTLGVREVERKGRREPEGDGTRRAAHARVQGTKLAELIEASLSVESAGLTARDGRLLVTATRESHSEVARLLNDLRRERALGATIETAVVPVSPEALAALPAPLARKLRRAVFAGVLPHVLGITEDELKAVLASIPEDIRAEGLLPEVTAFNHQVSHVTVVTQASLVVDVELSRGDTGTKAEPVTGILNTGTVVQLQPAINRDGSSIALGLKIETVRRIDSRAVLASELERFRGVLEVGDWTIEIPRLERSVMETTVNLPAGEWALAGSLESDLDDESATPRVVLVRGRVDEME